VSEEDIASLESQVDGDLRRVVAEDWTAQLPDGRAMLAPSVEAGDPDYTIEQAAGDISDTVTLSGTVDATGLEYDDAAVKEQARSNYETALSSQVPEGYELVPDSIVLGDPELVSESPNTVEFTMSANATVRASFDAAAQDRLASDLAGANADEVDSILANVPAFENASVSRDPGWWLERMPQSSDRVTISIAETVANSPDPEGATPAATPASGEDG
jgi:hypothetical protein